MIRLRARRANFGHHTTSMAMMVLVAPMPSAAAIASARMIGGKHSTRSVMRMIELFDLAARIGRNAADQRAERGGDQHDDDAGGQRDARADRGAA